jgi:hypothetical protein
VFGRLGTLGWGGGDEVVWPGALREGRRSGCFLPLQGEMGAAQCVVVPPSHPIAHRTAWPTGPLDPDPGMGGGIDRSGIVGAEKGHQADLLCFYFLVSRRLVLQFKLGS